MTWILQMRGKVSVLPPSGWTQIPWFLVNAGLPPLLLSIGFQTRREWDSQGRNECACACRPHRESVLFVWQHQHNSRSPISQPILHPLIRVVNLRRVMGQRLLQCPQGQALIQTAPQMPAANAMCKTSMSTAKYTNSILDVVCFLAYSSHRTRSQFSFRSLVLNWLLIWREGMSLALKRSQPLEFLKATCYAS